MRVFRADDARPLDEFPDALRRVMGETDHIYVDLPPGGGPKRSRAASAKSLLKVCGQLGGLSLPGTLIVVFAVPLSFFART